MNKSKKICVIGAGVMGAGIAAHIANSDNKVLLLDIASSGIDKNQIAKNAIDRMLKQKPYALSHPLKIQNIEIGNLEDDLSKIKNCSWVIEAVTEKLNIKSQVYNLITPYLANDAAFSSNTSTIPLKNLKSTIAEDIRPRFFITHFFNPPRYVKLVEIVEEGSDKKLLQAISNFITSSLGKTVIKCNDTPGFIANRIGCFLLEYVTRQAILYKVDIQIIDKLFNKHFGFPKTGIFGLIDLIGLDVMKMIAASLIELLPKEDRFCSIYSEIPELDNLITQGFIGRKGKGGFYRLAERNGQRYQEVLSLEDWNYYEKPDIKLPHFDSQEALLKDDSSIGLTFRNIFTELAVYTCSLIPEVSSSAHDLNDAVKIGYNWKYGPFELMKIFLGSVKFIENHARKLSLEIPEFIKSGQLESMNLNRASDTKKTINIIDGNDFATLIELPDKIMQLSFKTKMNCMNEGFFDSLIRAIDIAEESKKPLVIYNDASYFSAGADLKRLSALIKAGDFKAIEFLISSGQKAMLRLKYSKVPIASCAKGIALGGGFEILLHSPLVIANIETYGGLVESTIGLLPGWGGVKEMILKGSRNKESLTHHLKLMFEGYKTGSAEYIKYEYGLSHIKINMNSDLLLEEAIKYVKNYEDKFTPASKAPKVKIPYVLFRDALDQKVAPAQELLASKIQEFIDLKEATEEELLAKEKEVFLELIKTSYAQESISAIMGH